MSARPAIGRRSLLAALVVALASCRSVPLPSAGPDLASLLPADPPRHPGRPLLLVAMPDSPTFHLVRRSLIGELKDDFDISTFLVPPRMTLPEFARRLEQQRPRALVVMDNPVLALYRAHAARTAAGNPVPPAVVLMTSFLQELAPVPGVTGVAYEVPAVTALSQLRAIVKAPVRRVAVLHRPGFRSLVARQAALAAREQIALVPFEVRGEPTPGEIRNVLQHIRRASDIDALWMLNDNALLGDSDFRAATWRAEIPRFRIPVIVGLPNLVTGQDRFGDFAVVPDHEALAVQTAQLIFKLAASDWRTDAHPIELPISTLTLANLARLAQLAGLQPHAEERIDHVVR
jgi:putative ABC transport system substrate-binding protein